MNAHETCALANEKLDLIRLALKKYSFVFAELLSKIWIFLVNNFHRNRQKGSMFVGKSANMHHRPLPLSNNAKLQMIRPPAVKIHHHRLGVGKNRNRIHRNIIVVDHIRCILNICWRSVANWNWGFFELLI